MSLFRLQKIISSAGICSRRAAEKYILNGLVSVNGQIVTILGSKADPELDEIRFANKRIMSRTKFIYVVLNKPRGYVTSCSQTGSKVVTDLVKLPNRLFPVGRLDKDSTGLLILTNDGMLHHRLSHPSFGHEKEYYVETLRPFSGRFIDIMRKGILLDSRITQPARVTRMSNNKFKIVIKEGRNRQIRRMVESLHNKVSILKRIRICNVKLGTLGLGKWRFIQLREKKELMRNLMKI